jgi:hypothetical protein
MSHNLTGSAQIKVYMNEEIIDHTRSNKDEQLFTPQHPTFVALLTLISSFGTKAQGRSRIDLVGKKGNSRTRMSGSRLAGRLLIRPAALLPLLVPFCSAMAAGLGGIIPATATEEDKGRLAVPEGDAVVWFGLAC